MDELREKAESFDSLWEKVDRYGVSSTLDAHITKLNDSLVEGKKCWKKGSKDAVEVCSAFEAGPKVLQHKKDD